MSNPLQTHPVAGGGSCVAPACDGSTPDEPDFRLSGPDAVIASIPYLIGFHPQDSVVVVWLRNHRAALTQRVDVPSRECDIDAEAAATVAMARPAAADSAVILIFGQDPWELPGSSDAGQGLRGEADAVTSPLPADGWREDIASALQACLERERVACLDILHVFEDRWWSYLCQDGCCPRVGRRLDPQVQAEVASWLGSTGSPPAPSRQAVVADLDADQQARAIVQPEVERIVAALTARLAGAASPAAELEQWRSEQIRDLLPVFSDSQQEPRSQPASHANQDDAKPADDKPADDKTSDDKTSDDKTADDKPADQQRAGQLLVALADIRVRDTLLWHLAASTDPRRSLSAMLGVLRAAGPGHIAPIATCTAIAAWLTGDGVRASAAAQRALADDGEYVLGVLVARSLAAGLAPAAWREVMRQVTLEECRTGRALAE
ncbi:MAG: DUF4192 family protein [Actinomycetales bacterium]|nr:DUF4192 family protein [Actinomycetales bacterium]